MSKITPTTFALLSLLFIGNTSGNYAAQSKENTSEAATGTLQKMIVENGSVAMDLDLNRLNGIRSVAARPVTVRFDAAANSFFTILVFNDLLRGPEPGSMALALQKDSSVGVNAPRLQPTCGNIRISQATGYRETSFRRGFRSRCARRQNGIHLFQH